MLNLLMPLYNSLKSFSVVTVALITISGAAPAGLPAVGPNYKSPTPDVPSAYKGNGSGKSVLSEENWWRLFADAELSRLLDRVDLNSRTLRVAAARLDQAKAALKAAKADFFPQVSAVGSAARSRLSTATDIAYPFDRTTMYRTAFEAAYEVDLWGRVRRNVEAAKAEFQAGTAGLEALRLSLRAETARVYFTLRAVEGERDALDRAIGKRREALKLTQSRLDAGTGNELDVERAKTELAAAQTELTALGQVRAELENALAVLLGENASDFRVSAPKSEPALPQVPTGVPSELLQRRPDVAEAERHLAAANARIGVAKTAYFPSLRLAASGGWEANETKKLSDEDSRAGSVGFSFSLPLFDGGKRKAGLDQSKAAHQEAAQAYQHTVLTAFQEVENALSAVQVLARQSEELQRALTSAQKAAELSRTRYNGGLVSYFEVIEADRTVLQFERSAAQLRGERLTAAAALIKALGGGWIATTSAPSVPTPSASK